MTSYGELARTIAEEIAAGQVGEGHELPALRTLARDRGASQATALRAYRELAEAGVITTEERRVGRVAPGGALAAARFLRGGGIFRLAGSDDPALLLLLGETPTTVELVADDGSGAGLAALQADIADGAALHLWHASGAYNAPYARGVVADARLVHLWSREAGLLVAPGNPRRVRRAADLGGLRVARRPVGTGARSLLDRVTGEAGIVLDASDPEVPRNLDVALAVASGSADAGVAVALGGRPLRPRRSSRWPGSRSAIAVGGDALGGLDPLLRALRSAAVRKRIEALGGYDLTGSGQDGALLMARRRAPPRGHPPPRRRRPPPPPRTPARGAVRVPLVPRAGRRADLRGRAPPRHRDAGGQRRDPGLPAAAGALDGLARRHRGARRRHAVPARPAGGQPGRCWCSASFSIFDAFRLGRAPQAAAATLGILTLFAIMPHAAIGYYAYQSYDTIETVFADDEPNDVLEPVEIASAGDGGPVTLLPVLASSNGTRGADPQRQRGPAGGGRAALEAARPAERAAARRRRGARAAAGCGPTR